MDKPGRRRRRVTGTGRGHHFAVRVDNSRYETAHALRQTDLGPGGELTLPAASRHRDLHLMADIQALQLTIR
jgi:hypothetical protein